MKAPGFVRRHEFYPMVPQELEKHPTDSLFSFVHDFNRDGWPDILVCGRVKHHEAFWYENRAETEDSGRSTLSPTASTANHPSW